MKGVEAAAPWTSQQQNDDLMATCGTEAVEQRAMPVKAESPRGAKGKLGVLGE
jgi:hypothetical protein